MGRAQVKVAVYDHFWSTLGGGEQFAGGIAAALRDEHDVTLIGPEPVDTARFRERLGIDLDGLPFYASDFVVDIARASAEFDLFINCTYQSQDQPGPARVVCRALFRRGALLAQQRVKDGVRRRFGRRATGVVLRSGFHQAAERGGAAPPTAVA